MSLHWGSRGVFSFPGPDFDAVFYCPILFSETHAKHPLVCHILGSCPWCVADLHGWWLDRCAGGNLAHSERRGLQNWLWPRQDQTAQGIPSIFLISFLALLGFTWWGLVKQKSFLLLPSAYEDLRGKNPVSPERDKISIEVYRNFVWERILKIRPQIFILWYNASLQDKQGCWQSANETVCVWVSLLF